MRVQTHPCTRERRSRVGVTWQCTVAQEGTTLMLRNDFVKNIKYKLSIPEALGSSGYRQDRYPTPTPTERGQQSKPVLISLLSLVDALSWLSSLLHPSAWCSLFPAQGSTLFPSCYVQLVCVCVGGGCIDGRVGSG